MDQLLVGFFNTFNELHICSFFLYSYLRQTSGLSIRRSQTEAIFVTTRKAGIEPTLTVLETAFLPLEDFRMSIAKVSTLAIVFIVA